MPRTRSLEIWHIPKRQNIHQIIGAVEILAQDNFHGKSWTLMKQENFNTQLGRAGLTNNGRPLSPSARRTLEALIKYLGFIHIENTPKSPLLHVTPAGFQLIQAHGSILGKRKNLRQVQEHGEEIIESEIVKQQLIKLQISNPLIKADCSNISLFPFRITLMLLKQLAYLSKDELGYIVFAMKTTDEFAQICEKILAYRSLSLEQKHALITEFKATEIGNLTLVQAPTAAYYMGLCIGSGLCERTANNLSIKPDKQNEVSELLNQFDAVTPFHFEDNLQLWIDYIGTPARLIPPRLVSLSVDHHANLYVRIFDQDQQEIGHGVISSAQPTLTVPLFLHETYHVEIYRVTDGAKIYDEYTNVNHTAHVFHIAEQTSELIRWDFAAIVSKIHDLIKNKDFDTEYQQHIAVIKKITGKDQFNTAQLRGGRLEYLFFKLFSCLKDTGDIDQLVWNGRMNHLELAYPALGGKDGLPDIYFFIGQHLFILELTTIRAGAMQWQAEGASVHDHIVNLSKQLNDHYQIIGLFCAPSISPRITTMFKHISSKEHLLHLPMTIDDFIQTVSAGKNALLDLFTNTCWS